jgi:penicillin G amidase
MQKTLETGGSTNASWQTARRLVTDWGRRAAVDSQGYRLVRGFRLKALELLFAPMNHQLSQFHEGMKIANEDAAWAILTERPSHLLDPQFAGYDQLLSNSVDRVLGDLKEHGIELTNATWGSRNRLQIRHPLSQAVPRLGRWLDMPDAPVSGDSHMPKVHAPGSGVSERMVVSPGHEEKGLFNMPGGQSGHFLSPYFRSEMDAWLQVTPQPFLPGPKQHALRLVNGRTG